MTENEFIHIVPQLRQITLQISQGYGVGCDEAEDIAQDAMLKLWASVCCSCQRFDGLHRQASLHRLLSQAEDDFDRCPAFR